MSYDEWKLRSPDDDRELREGRQWVEPKPTIQVEGFEGDEEALADFIAEMKRALLEATEIAWAMSRAYEGYLPDPDRVDTRGDVNTRLMAIADWRATLRRLEQMAS